MRRKSASLTAFLMCIGIAWFLPHSVLAKVQNQFCGNCHTMHNSQDGETVIDETQRHLLGQDCLGCHTGRNEGTSATPYVYDLDGPTYGSNTLAGGNFYWVATAGEGNDTKGHNVLDLSGQDTNIEASEGAPGGSVSCANSCHNTLAVAQSAAGYEDLGSGCEGCHLDVKHHADDSTDTVVGEDNGWYRFLAGHDSGAGNGVEGIEDDDWEYTSSAADHNEYLGLVGDHTAHAGFLNLGNTMTGYCCG